MTDASAPEATPGQKLDMLKWLSTFTANIATNLSAIDTLLNSREIKALRGTEEIREEYGSAAIDLGVARTAYERHWQPLIARWSAEDTSRETALVEMAAALNDEFKVGALGEMERRMGAARQSIDDARYLLEQRMKASYPYLFEAYEKPVVVPPDQVAGEIVKRIEGTLDNPPDAAQREAQEARYEMYNDRAATPEGRIDSALSNLTAPVTDMQGIFRGLLPAEKWRIEQ